MTATLPTLPDSPEALKEIIRSLLALRDRYEKDISLLSEQVNLLRSQLYGRKSEKVIPKNGPQPLYLFDMPEPEGDNAEDEDKGTHVSAHTRRQRGRRPLPADLPRTDIVHDIDDADKVCACGCELKRIGEDVSEQLDIEPAKVRVLRHIRPKYACPACEGVEDSGSAVKIAPVHAQLIPKSIASPGLLAHLLTGKFVDHLPFYRQEQQLKRFGVEITRTTMCRWAMQVASACEPLLDLLKKSILSGKFINIDETSLQVLKEPGRSPTRKSYMWIFRRGDPEHTVLLYQYHPTRAGDVANRFLRGFEGVVQTDGYAGYDFLDADEKIRHIGCWAHARRKFLDVGKGQGKKGKSGAAGTALRYIKKLYRIERKARQENYTLEQLHQVRQAEARPILEEFRKWLLVTERQTPPKGLLGRAVSYTLKQWPRLTGYIEDGVSTIDNNMAENSIRPFVVGRKNWLFAGTPDGARASALLYSLIETAKANKVEPYAYLRHIFERLPLLTSQDEYEQLLPWNVAV